MSKFRLARLLSLREDQAKAEKLRWAQAQRAAQDAVARRDQGRQRVRDARAELSTDHERAGVQSGRVVATAIHAYGALDALNDRASADDEALAEARRVALEAREPYDTRRREVEALKRLEERWTKERRRQLRRRENLELEEFINGRSQSDPSNPTAPGDSPA